MSKTRRTVCTRSPRALKSLKVLAQDLHTPRFSEEQRNVLIAGSDFDNELCIERRASEHAQA
jgi:hypothetical protein